MSIKVVKPGLATSIQDTGREGFYHLGIPPSGALDQYSMKMANLLVNNNEGDAVFECALLGPELIFEYNSIVAVCGARMQPKLDGEPMPLDTAFSVKQGQTLSFNYPTAGARAYLAISGGVDVPVTLGSRSTYTLGSLGGFKGRRLEAGDTIAIGTPVKPAIEGKSVPQTLLPSLAKEVSLRMIPGMYIHRLVDAAVEQFYEDTWTVGSEADRIGYRFKDGHPMQFVEREQPFGAGSDPSNIVDACYPIGSIQIPAGKEPIVLHRDAVSGGGYATIGTVISADLDLIGQMQPNYKARFIPITMEEALDARKVVQERLIKLKSYLQT
ncbi:biotin-dependent carboxyltransferase family protein [Neptunomonas phycophila]|uniref:Biotin-dependent carboxyltransferase family protein n=1 Tax=Neptunomonas phycophila TaxID=1572645 RepID=A0ABT9ER74_9GAMM|nr:MULTISPECIES: biotin-dependent carboxyltransferase family protein [Neptunomonas]MDN2658535.1 biotin-dependent carboxyltransferase family protein [Neptunomonas sp. CHC150]MDP2521474.1 biotin-dependent carboxyltransferase family protein [Neptunomonas phycophila]